MKKDHFFCALLMPKFFSFNAESDGLQRLQEQKKRAKTILFSMSDIS